MKKVVHEKFLNELRKIARDVTPVGAARIAASIVYKNNVVAFGINSLKTHPIQVKYARNPESIHLHAEIDVIKNASRILTPEEFAKSTMYVARMKYADMHKTSMMQGLVCPCDGCRNAIIAFNLKKVIYTLDGIGYGEL